MRPKREQEQPQRELFQVERNRLKGVAGDAFNAILSAAAMNFYKLLRAFWRNFLCSLLDIRDQFRRILAPVGQQMQCEKI